MEQFEVLKPEILRPGDLVPTSGVYAVLHSTPHKLLESEEYFEGSRFRECGMCAIGPWYRLQAPKTPALFTKLPTKGELAIAGGG